VVKETSPSKKNHDTEDEEKEMEEGAQKNIKGGECDVAKRRKRRKVMKAKQYLDEEGFMVTQKVYESESYSEESDQESKSSAKPNKEPENPKTKTNQINNTTTTKKKAKTQSSLGSFFKKLK